MATTKPKTLTIDVLLLNHKGIDGKYIELPPDYNSDNGATETKIKGVWDFLKTNLEAGTKTEMEGIEYKTTAPGDVGIDWNGFETFTPELLAEAQAVIDRWGEDWAKANAGWKKQKSHPNPGYTGFALQKK